MIALAAIFSLSSDAHAQACTCSRNVALPSGNVQRAGAGIVSVEYGVSLEADPAKWQGLEVVDRYGDSMAGMYMPPMLVQTGALTATVGLPEHFSVSTTVPYMYKNNLGESEMPGDTDLRSFNDIDLTLKWGHSNRKMSSFYGAAAGLTFPTGTVIPYSPVRSGRGVMGAVIALQAGTKLAPKLAIAGQLSGATGFGADETGYVVAPNASAVFGGRWSPRENGRVNFALFALERWSGHDRKDALVYRDSGYLITDLSVAASYTFWEKALRSASFTVRAQAPLYQIVGDPMYAENFGGSLTVSVVAF